VEEIRAAFSILDAAVIAVPSDAAALLFAHTRKGVQSQLDLSCICLEEKDLIGSYSSDFTLQKETARLVFVIWTSVLLLRTDFLLPKLPPPAN
jgi:hypothetical protein